MANKPLAIDSRAGLPTGESGHWSTMANTPVFVRDIITPAIKSTTSVGDIVSGIPTAFARLDLFKAALDRANLSGNNNAATTGLNTYYVTLVSEWRGFIAALALDYTKFEVKHLDLVYSDGKDVSETANIYEPLGAFGNMLLERKPLWCAPKANSTAKEIPFIDIIKYDGKVIGGTSPETFLFTSVGYKLNAGKQRPWVDAQTGKFVDPVKADMSEDQTVTLYAYVGHTIQNIGKVQQYYSHLDQGVQPRLNNVINNLTQWQTEIEAYARNHGYDLSANSVPPVDIAFDAPFNYIFTFKDELYGMDGALTITAADGYLPFDPKKALLPKDSEIARIILDETYDRNPGLIADLPVYVLKAPKKQAPDEYAYFALPLSALGLNVFGRNVGAVAGVTNQGNALKSTMTAVYDEESTENNLEVTLTLVTNEGQRKTMKESYTVRPDKAIHKKDLILWPNFISRRWNKYFLYSEMPHNAQSADYPYRAMPFVGDKSTDYSRILVDSNSEPVYLAKDGRVINHTDGNGHSILDAQLLVEADTRVADNAYKYEIYQSNLPFKGVRLLSQTQKDGGFLVINYTSDRSKGLPLNKMGTSENIQPADLGVDFGSTNTSVAYFDRSNNEAKGMKFKNRRISLLASATDSDTRIPKEKQIFFFQSGEISSNAIKSVLTQHDPRRLKLQDEGSEVNMMSREVKGGMPSFVNNLPVVDVTPEEIKLRFPGCGDVSQIHNMKWSDQPIDNAHKEAFLRSLMLHVYAQMYDEGFVPTNLKWSYPSSMGDNMLISYRSIWNSLRDMSPVVDENGERVALNVCTPLNSRLDMDGDANPFGDSPATFGPMGNDIFGAADPFATGGQSADPFGAPAVTQNIDPFGATNDPFAAQAATAATDPFAANNPFGGNNAFDNTSNQVNKAPAIPDFMPDDDKPKSFNPIPLPADRSLTEACAVANYLIRKESANAGDKLTLCFDIGGSTTDFSALCRLKQGGATMIKQNSIRFAAQRVSEATKKSPKFKDVLINICAKFNITLMGLNRGPNTYSPNTAPYFFEQIVDRLEPKQLPEFYSEIAAKCPELMSVNLYVTGLITFYAGQIAAKLIREIFRSPDRDWTGKPQVKVVFAGKGARIFEWFSTIQMDTARQYYTQMFMKGMGGQQKMVELLSNWPEIKLSEQSSDDVKFEVSKGLASSNTILSVPKDDVVIEIIGEEGFSVVRPNGEVVKLEADNSISPEMMRHMGRYFKAPQPSFGQISCPRFKEFAGLFYMAASRFFGFRMSTDIFNKGFQEMSIDGYITNTKEFQQALRKEQQNIGKFDFVAPVIILEGMKFYDEYLLPNLNKA